MNVGTKSLLFGAHQFLIHPLCVLFAWIRLYRELPNWKEFVCIVIHDWGYWGKSNMDGQEGSSHPEWAAGFAGKWLDDDTDPEGYPGWNKYRWLCLHHSRHLVKEFGGKPSRLCWADKYSIVFMPWWLYLPMAWLSGELFEYRCKNISTTPLSATHREWFRNVKEIMLKVALEQDGGAAPYMDKGA